MGEETFGRRVLTLEKTISTLHTLGNYKLLDAYTMLIFLNALSDTVLV